MKVPSCPRTLIINILRKNPDGLTLTSIAELTGLHRHTATKYVYELKGAGVISERDVGSAKLCYLREGFSREEQKKVVERLNGNKEWKKSSSSMGQVQILTIFMFLFLVPASIIIAQNATQSNDATGRLILEQMNITPGAFTETNLTSPEEINSSAIAEVYLIPITSEQNETIPSENQTTAPEGNQTSQEENITQENPTENLTIVNETIANETIHNETDTSIILPENQTPPEVQEDAIIPEVLQPILTVRISSPEKTFRGEQFDVSAIVSNTGNSEARNVRLEWILSDGFEIVSGQDSAECGTISPDSECMSSLTLSTPISADIGKNEIGVVVSYEE
jgi:predicted transcriptional regulator